MQKRIFTYLLFAFALFGFLVFPISCSEDKNPDPVCNDPSNPECPNYDPCLESKPVSAEFKIEYRLAAAAPWVDSFVEE